MDISHLLFNDPIVLISMIGLLTVLGICGYYVYYFMKHIEQDTKDHQ